MPAILPNRTVYVLEDDPLFRQLTAGMARKCCFAPVTFDTTDALEAACTERSPDLIVLDLALGDDDGVAVLDQLARSCCAAPIMVVSDCDERVLASARRVGHALGLTMLDPLKKSVPPARFMDALERAHRTTQPIRQQDFAEALARREFTAYYQPQITLPDRRPIGVEALVRWNHPQRGVLLPGAFIPLLESGDHITPLTLFMIERALADRHGWSIAGHDLTVAVNVCARSLVERDFPDRVAEIVRAAGCKPSDLILEITETAAMSDTPWTMAALSRLRTHGFGLSMDDFGTGYSSLRELHRMPFTELKIDRSFVSEMETDPNARKIVEAVVGLARALGLKSVAEGVEDKQTLSSLADMGCDIAQGYLIGRPRPPEHLALWLTMPERAVQETADSIPFH